MSSSLRKWVLEQKARGVTEDQIKSFLVQKGYDTQSIDSAMNGTVHPSESSKEPQSKRNIIIISSIILVLLIGAAFVFFFTSGKSTIIVCEDETCFSNLIQDCSAGEYIFQGTQGTILAEVRGYEKDTCLITYSIEADNAVLSGRSMTCNIPENKIQDVNKLLDDTIVLRDLCEGSLAEVFTDPCVQMQLAQEGFSTDECYLTQAQVTGDRELCNKIENNEKKDDCLSEIPDPDTASCEELSLFLQSDCFQKKALSEKDITFCKMIDSSVLQDSCIERMAYQQVNINLCANISSNRSKESCKETVSVIEGGESGCQEKLNLTDKNSCYFDLAYGILDEDMCSLIVDEDETFSRKNMCYQLVAGSKKDPSICDLIDKQETKSRCKLLAGNS